MSLFRPSARALWSVFCIGMGRARLPGPVERLDLGDAEGSMTYGTVTVSSTAHSEPAKAVSTAWTDQ